MIPRVVYACVKANATCKKDDCNGMARKMVPILEVTSVNGNRKQDTNNVDGMMVRVQEMMLTYGRIVALRFTISMCAW